MGILFLAHLNCAFLIHPHSTKLWELSLQKSIEVSTKLASNLHPAVQQRKPHNQFLHTWKNMFESMRCFLRLTQNANQFRVLDSKSEGIKDSFVENPILFRSKTRQIICEGVRYLVPNFPEQNSYEVCCFLEFCTCRHKRLWGWRRCFVKVSWLECPKRTQ